MWIASLTLVKNLLTGWKHQFVSFIFVLLKKKKFDNLYLQQYAYIIRNPESLDQYIWRN